MKKILLIILVSFLLAGCDTFHGCGPMVSKRVEYTYTTKPFGSGYKTEVSNTYYIITFRGDDGKNYQCYTSPDRYESAKVGDIFCIE